MSMADLAGGAAQRVGAAKRGRKCQLRLFLKHERMTVRMALAEALHHSCGVGQRNEQRLAGTDD